MTAQRILVIVMSIVTALVLVPAPAAADPDSSSCTTGALWLQWTCTAECRAQVQLQVSVTGPPGSWGSFQCGGREIGCTVQTEELTRCQAITPAGAFINGFGQCRASLTALLVLCAG